MFVWRVGEHLFIVIEVCSVAQVRENMLSLLEARVSRLS
jgi:hypothetical protein